MPELPEVETICRNLQKHIRGKRILAAAARGRLRHTVDSATLQEFCRGREITDVSRRAKYLIIHFENNTGLLLHLGMTGAFMLTDNDNIPLKHEHAGWLLDDGRRWRFLDPRCFGALHLIPDLKQGHPILNALGLEPLSGQFNGKFLENLCADRTCPIKSLIMDQQHIVGVGNIYANESLFRTRIHPARPANGISARKLYELARNIRSVLLEAIEEGGTTISDYRQLDGSEGHFRIHLSVYGRTKQPCPRCGTEIRRIVIGGRSTFFCPKCQPFSIQTKSEWKKAVRS